MRAVTRIVFFADDDEKFFGEGPYRLLTGVEQTGSLHAASSNMGMAYSKAMKLLKRAEAVLGFPLTVRTVGGASGGGSTLTPQAKEWMERYAAYRDACIACNRSLYTQYFSEER